MKKILLASLLLVSAVSMDANAFWGFGGDKEAAAPEIKVPGKPEFKDGCFVAPADAKGPLADAGKKADADGNGCVTEDEFKAYMKANKPDVSKMGAEEKAKFEKKMADKKAELEGKFGGKKAELEGKVGAKKAEFEKMKGEKKAALDGKKAEFDKKKSAFGF